MKTTRFTTGAEAEYDRAIAYYEGKKEGLGVDFQTEVERTVDTIRRVPGVVAPFKKTGYRFLGLHRFPYVIYYKEYPKVSWSPL